jgi:hypothetical protein
MPSPLTDELSPEAKAELAAQFAEMKRYGRFAPVPRVKPWTRNRRQFWERP